MFVSNKAQTSISSEAPRFYNGYAQTSKIGTPEETGFGYQLPSPLEDDVLLDPMIVDKEVRPLLIEAPHILRLSTPVRLACDSRCSFVP